MEYDEEIDKVYTPEEMKEFYKNLEAYDKKYLKEQSKIKKVLKKWSEMTYEEKKDFFLNENSVITHLIHEKDMEESISDFQDMLEG